MNGRNLFDFFGISYDASEDELKKRYRELVKKYHPDKNKSKDAKAKFQEIKQAYNELLPLIKKRDKSPDLNEEESFEDQWRNYRERARKISLAKERRQVEEMNAWYDELYSGLTWKYTRVVCIVSGLLILLLLTDLVLPKYYENDLVVGFDSKTYHSVDEHRISKILTQRGDIYWLDRYKNGLFNYNPFVKIKKTCIMHNAISIHKFDGHNYKVIPIELTVFWAQIMIVIALLLSLGVIFYRKRDVFFIMGSYYTRFFMGPFIIWFFLSNDRWIHIFTLGFL